jgi:hypothetical protein
MIAIVSQHRISRPCADLSLTMTFWSGPQN